MINPKVRGIKANQGKITEIYKLKHLCPIYKDDKLCININIALVIKQREF